MSDFDINILKTNIKALMKEHGEKQSDLSDLLGISQPNISQCLNTNEKRCFTLEQAFLIANHYGTTIDALVGNAKKDSHDLSPRSICSWLVALLEKRIIYYFEHEVEDEIYTPQAGYEYDVHEQKNKYYGFYFPSYFYPPKIVQEWQLEEMEYDAKTLGNALRENMDINIFLNRFMDDFEKHQGLEMDDATYDVVKKAFMDAIPDQPSNKKKKPE